MPAAAVSGSSGVWSRRRDEITFDRLQKFWFDLTPQARQDLLKLDKQTLIEHARKNSHCSRCHGLLLDCFTQIAMYGKALRQEASDDVHLSMVTAKSSRVLIRQVEQDGAQDPSSVHHPWGGLSTTNKDDILTLLDCFVNAKSPTVLQNVFDCAQARERERRMRYPDACGASGRGYGTREMCALHTAHPSCDALADFWSPLGEETRSSLLRMREDDFIEKLTRRFNRKKFCRDCRKNVMHEFKELKEPKRTQKERRCNCWFCVDNGFQCEVFEDGIIVDWSQCLSEADRSFHHFEWAVGTREGESDIFGFEDVGMNARVHKTGINLVKFENYFITVRAWRSDNHCTEYCVKAHVLKGQSQSCVHLQHRLVVSDGFVTITDGESMKSFFERAEKVEEEDENADLDADGSHTQKHAKSPELAREFLLDSASVIFKEQVVKAFRDGTAQENAKSVFVSLALKLLEVRVHVACKELITLEKQDKLLEEEEKEMRKEQERRMKRKMKEREKKHKQKQKLKEKVNDKGSKLVDSKSSDDMKSLALNNTPTSANHESTNTPCSRDSAKAQVLDLCSLGRKIDQSSCRENKVGYCNGATELFLTDSSECCCTSEQSDSQDEHGRIGDSQWQLIGRKLRRARGCSSIVPKGGHIGSAQKNTVQNKVWQPLDTRKNIGVYIRDNASGYQKLCIGCDEPLPLASKNSRNLYKLGTDQACEDRMTNSDSSSSLSSCTGDGDSSSSSVTILSDQSPESSLYDEPEGCLESIVSKLDTPLRIQNPDLVASRSLLETCSRKGFREYRPEGTRPTHSDRYGSNILFQGQHLHHQSMRLSPNSSAKMQLHNHCWASPTNKKFQYDNCQVRYNNVNPYLAHQQCHMHPRPIEKTTASFSAMSPSPPCQNGAKQIIGHPLTDMNQERCPSNKLKPLGHKDLPEDNGETQDFADGSFSLFQFSLPIASSVAASSENDKTKEFADRMLLAHVQAQLCSREQTDVKQYKLFSTKDSGMFSFMQIK